jgi:predicted ester cyclase
LRVTEDGLIAEGDKVVEYWSFIGTHKDEFTGVAATGKPVTSDGSTTRRIAGGKTAETWVHWDQLSFLQQVGKAPS